MEENATMPVLTSIRDTFLKKSPEPESNLMETEKQLYKMGETIDIEQATPAPNGHWEIILAGGEKGGYIVAKDWSPVPPSLLAEEEINEQVPEPAIEIITEFEGFFPDVYYEDKNIPAIGIGTTHYPDGKAVSFGDLPISKETARKYLAHDLEKIIDRLVATIPFWYEMNSHQCSALISFAYNVGAGFYGASGFKTITSALRDKRWDDVPKALELYSEANDPVVQAGLLRRRQAEGELWQGKGKFAR
jgi:GH24 family phage-related lysozyme (muramidase)